MVVVVVVVVNTWEPTEHAHTQRTILRVHTAMPRLTPTRLRAVRELRLSRDRDTRLPMGIRRLEARPQVSVSVFIEPELRVAVLVAAGTTLCLGFVALSIWTLLPRPRLAPRWTVPLMGAYATGPVRRLTLNSSERWPPCIPTITSTTSPVLVKGWMEG